MPRHTMEVSKCEKHGGWLNLPTEWRDSHLMLAPFIIVLKTTDRVKKVSRSIQRRLGLDCIQPSLQDCACLGDRQIPFFTSDELPHYADVLLEVYGEQVQPPRYGNPGCFPKPNRVLPPDLNYAVVVKKPLITRDANQRTQRFVQKMETGNSCTGSGFDRSHLDYGGSRASSTPNSHGLIYVHASLVLQKLLNRPCQCCWFDDLLWPLDSIEFECAG